MQAIIMLTRCVEMGKVSHNVFSKSVIISLNTQEKCVQYWPSKLHDRYSGDRFTVTLTSTTPHVEYGIRHFEVHSVSNLVLLQQLVV